MYGKKSMGGAGGGKKGGYINHNQRPSGSNPKVPTESVQGEIDKLAKGSTHWASHKGARK